MTDRNYVIIDLDGTLCNDSHRKEWAEAKQWDEYHSRLLGDPVHEDVATALSTFQEAGKTVMIFSGRPEAYRHHTQIWLLRHNIDVAVIMMRGVNDYRKAEEVKLGHLTTMFNSIEEAKEQILVIFEDNDKVVQWWRDLGFRCWQVAPGGY